MSYLLLLTWQSPWCVTRANGGRSAPLASPAGPMYYTAPVQKPRNPWAPIPPRTRRCHSAEPPVAMPISTGF